MERDQAHQRYFLNGLEAEKFCTKHFLNQFLLHSGKLKFFIYRTNATTEENNMELKLDSIAYLLASFAGALVLLIAGTICVDCFNQVAISQVTQIRVKYFASLMQQNIGWYDIEKSKTNFTVRLAE